MAENNDKKKEKPFASIKSTAELIRERKRRNREALKLSLRKSTNKKASRTA